MEIKYYPVILDFSAFMRSLESASIGVKSVKTGRYVEIRKMKHYHKMSQQACDELMTYYPGLSVSIKACENIEGQLSHATMQEIKDLCL